MILIPHPPVMAGEIGELSESGRGLLLVDALSSQWSYFRVPGKGKVVYCLISLLKAVPP